MAQPGAAGAAATAAAAIAEAAAGNLRRSDQFAQSATGLAVEALHDVEQMANSCCFPGPQVEAVMDYLQDTALYRIVGDKGAVQVGHQLQEMFGDNEELFAGMTKSMLREHRAMLKFLLANKVLLREVGIATKKCHGLAGLDALADDTSKELLACLDGSAEEANAAKADALGIAVMSQPDVAPAFAASAMAKVRLSNHFAALAKVLAVEGLEKGKAVLGGVHCAVHKTAPEVKAAMRQLQDKAFYRLVGSERTIQLRTQLEAMFVREKALSERMIGCMFQAHKGMLGGFLNNKVLVRQLGSSIEGAGALKALAAKVHNDILSSKVSTVRPTPVAPVVEVVLAVRNGFIEFGASENLEIKLPKRSTSWSPCRNSVCEGSGELTMKIDLGGWRKNPRGTAC